MKNKLKLAGLALSLGLGLTTLGCVPSGGYSHSRTHYVRRHHPSPPPKFYYGQRTPSPRYCGSRHRGR